MAAPGAIFISYRRKDSQIFTDRIYERLAAYFGVAAVFRDMDSIQYGEKFPERLQIAVQACQVMVVVIGETWATIAAPNGQPRLLQPQDWARQELEGAVSRQIPIIPALLDNVPPPQAAQLPMTLPSLWQYNAIPILSGHDFDSDMGRLIPRLEQIVGVPDTQPPVPGAHRLRLDWCVAGAGCA
jgi:hypothetical protein